MSARLPNTQEAAERAATPLLRCLPAPFDEWLSDPATEEVCINRPGEVWVRQRGAFCRYDVPLALDDLESIAILAGSLRRVGFPAVGNRIA
jgi:type IV secretion system protein VirB11